MSSPSKELIERLGRKLVVSSDSQKSFITGYMVGVVERKAQEDLEVTEEQKKKSEKQTA